MRGRTGIRSKNNWGTGMSSPGTTQKSTTRYGRVAVLMGGSSAERVISLETGRAVYEALRRKGVDVVSIDARDDVLLKLAEGGFDRAFIALHGRGGEDGVIQGALETLGLPYTGSGVAGSALAMDKVRSKRIWRQMDMPTPEFMLIESEQDLHDAVSKLGLPLMVKPVHEGSSCGASKLNDKENITTVWNTASQFEDDVLAECWVHGQEYTVAILGQKALPAIRLETPREFYDYQAKYELDSTQYICPCGLDEEKEAELCALALDAFNALGARGWGRVDMFIDESGEFRLIEVNTVPGMTSHSLVPMAARQAGIEFDELVIHILESSLEQEQIMKSATA